MSLKVLVEMMSSKTCTTITRKDKAVNIHTPSSVIMTFIVTTYYYVHYVHYYALKSAV